MCHILLTCCFFWKEWPFFTLWWQSLARLSHSQCKQQNLVYTSCSKVNIAVSFRPAPICHRCSWPIIFSPRPECSLKVSVMRTAQISETEGNLFPLSSNTAYKLTLDKSMKSLHYFECAFKLQFFFSLSDVIAVHYISISWVTRCYIWLLLSIRW